MSTNQAVIAASQLSLSAGGSRLLNEVSVCVRGGELLGIIGPNGAGKSTLLKLMAGIETPDSGTIHCKDKELSQYNARQRARLIAWLEQRPVLHWPLSVEQVVALGRLPWRGERQTMQSRTIDKALAFTGTGKLRERAFPTLSEGEKLLVNLARVLATEAGVILADEPVAALDPRHQLQVMTLLSTLAKAGTAVVAVLHDLTLAARFCDRLLLLHGGRTIAEGSAQQVLSPDNLARAYGIEAHLDLASRSVIIQGTQDKET